MSSASQSSPTPSLKPSLGERARTAQSRPRSRQRAPLDSAPYLPAGQDALLLPEDPATEENVQLLNEFVHPSHRDDKRRADTEDTLVAPLVNDAASEFDSEDEGCEEEEALRKRPWYRRPSPIWLLATAPISSIAMSATAAPRIEIYTLLACREHKPEYLPRRCHETTDCSVNDAVRAVTTGVSVSIYSRLPLLRLDAITVPQNGFVAPYEESKETSKCASDPVVQAAAAKIIAVLTTTMGILGCLTTAFWGSLSDKRGRLRVLSIAMVGLLFNDIIFISVFFFSRQLPGGYWFLIFGPVVEGLLGGLTSMIAAIHAYIADVSPPGERSRQFSLGAGLLFVGMAFGPSFGALLVHFTHTPMAVFYLATGVHAVLALYVSAIVPESLPKRTQRANRLRHERRHLVEAGVAELEATEGEEVEERGLKRIVRVLGKTKRVFSFLSPLSVFAPIRIENMRKTQRDWNLVFIAASYGCSMFVLASYQYKFQYAAAAFNWTSEELGYWLSLVGGSRALYLTLILPFIIRIFNRPKQPIQLSIEPSEPLNAGHPMPSEPSSSTLVDSPPSLSLQRAASPSRRLPSESSSVEPPRTLTPHSANFDLRLARASLMWEVVCYALIPLAPSQYVFSIVGCLAAWGGGFGPAVQALALEMYVRRNAELKDHGDGDDEDGGRRGEAETGRLFGALSVVQSMCSQIFGPTLFGLVYMDTVSYFPTAIFWLSTMCNAIALVFMMSVRLPPHSSTHVAGHTSHLPGHISDSEEDSICRARDV